MDWMRELTDHGLNQGQATVEALLAIVRKAGDGLNQQASAAHHCSIAAAQETLSNVVQFGQKMARLREPQQLVQAHCDFWSRQAEIIASQTKFLGQNVAKEASEPTNETLRKAEASRKQSEAA